MIRDWGAQNEGSDETIQDSLGMEDKRRFWKNSPGECIRDDGSVAERTRSIGRNYFSSPSNSSDSAIPKSD